MLHSHGETHRPPIPTEIEQTRLDKLSTPGASQGQWFRHQPLSVQQLSIPEALFAQKP